MSSTPLRRSTRAATQASMARKSSEALRTPASSLAVPSSPDSPLTDLSDSSPDTAQNRPTARQPPRTPSSKRKRRASLPSPSKRSRAAPGPSSKAKELSGSQSSTATSRWLWVLVHSDKVAFARLDPGGNPVVDPRATNPAYWWPVKMLGVTHFDDNRVEVYGNDGHGHHRQLEFIPEEFNITRLRPDGRAYSFDSSNFASGCFSETLATAWRDALAEMEADDEAPERDEEPIRDSILSSPAKSRQNDKPRVMQYRPDEQPDETLVGVTVYARMPRRGPTTDHWPAKVVGVEMAKLPSGRRKPQYKVLFCDTRVKKLSRDQFFTVDDDGFAQCKAGKIEHLYHKEDMAAINGDGDETDSDDDIDDGGNPPHFPLKEDDFWSFPVSTQLDCVMPILKRVIRNNYPPTAERHDAFMRGGKARRSLSGQASQCGKLTAREVDRVAERIAKSFASGPAVLKSANDGNAATESKTVPVDPSGDQLLEADVQSPPQDSDATAVDSAEVALRKPAVERPTGDEQYEKLTPVERNLYALDVLLPEAILQILLWRAARKTSPDNLPDDQEAALHAQGLEMLSQTLSQDDQFTWVYEIKAKKERLDKERMELSSSQESQGGGTKSRPSKLVHYAE